LLEERYTLLYTKNQLGVIRADADAHFFGLSSSVRVCPRGYTPHLANLVRNAGC